MSERPSRATIDAAIEVITASMSLPGVDPGSAALAAWDAVEALLAAPEVLAELAAPGTRALLRDKQLAYDDLLSDYRDLQQDLRLEQLRRDRFELEA